MWGLSEDERKVSRKGRNESMIVQSVILPTQVCRTNEIYFQSKGNIDVSQKAIHMSKASEISSYAYMNLFDINTWYQYTGIKNWKLRMCVLGKGSLSLMAKNTSVDSSTLLQTVEFDNEQKEEIILTFEKAPDLSQIYFKIIAKQECWIYEANYLTDDRNNDAREIHLGVIICTYKRKNELYHNLNQLKESRFFDKCDELYGKMSIRIIDNASELPRINQKLMKLYHNPNTGGSGGFTRGIVETRKEEQEYGITHVIFMDDDVKFDLETFYRLYALLAHSKEEYQKEVVAGRMFRMDKEWIQYTAAEKWNAGDIFHISFNMDMTNSQSLINVNNNTGAEYSGWWFACFPMEFVKNHTPLPFFLHCDDVEYGLRQGGCPIILNGIQVWHETYEYRQSPIITYYDTKNPLIVNELYGLGKDSKEILDNWKRKITKYHLKNDYVTERMIILGMWDFLKGENYFLKRNVIKEHQKLLKKKKYLLHLSNALLWRLAERRIKKGDMRKWYAVDTK